MIQFVRFLSAALLAVLLSPHAVADDAAKAEKADQPKTIAELTAESERVEGLFNLFRDPKTGDLHMLIKGEQVDQEFIYFAQAANGVVEAGYFTGAYLANAVISVRRHYNRIELVAENVSFYFDPDSALARAADANISDAILAVETIVAEDPASGDILIKADKIFLGENLLQIKYPLPEGADANSTFTLGKLSDKKSKILATRNYPLNTDVEVEYVYNNPAPRAYGSSDVTDSRNVSIKVLHSLIAMPDNDYRPRYADPRVGTFDVQVTDLTSLSPTPYRDLVNRWNLVKKDPSAEISDPVEPITWWIENTTPLAWRDLIRDAALEWNKAFEKAGFSNAMVIKVQPDDADWDYGDIRYNVLRWTASPQPPFGGYGPSFVNPRTGEIIGADVMLEASFLNRQARAKWLLDDGFDAVAHNPNLMHRHCTLAQGLKSNLLAARTFGRFAPDYGHYGDEMDAQLTHDAMHYLILHEIGHTLGMNHNMKATQLLTPEEAFDAEVVAAKGLAGSVMDYPSVNYAPRGMPQTQFYATEPGFYDDWFIRFSYDPALDDPTQMAAHLDRSAAPELMFGNDADDMRAPGRGLDPRINIYDMSSDAVRYASMRMGLVQDTLNDMGPQAIDDGLSYQELYDGMGTMLSEWSRSAAVVSRYIGGVYVDRTMKGQTDAGAPFTPVPLERQQQAMEVLTRQVFAPDVFRVSPELLRYTAQQRRGFSGSQDPRLHDALLDMHKRVLDQLMHPTVLRRITDTGLYGNEYGLGQVMNDLTAAIFESDRKGDVNAMRQNLQMEYVQRLAKLAQGNRDANGYHSPAVSAAIYQLGQIQRLISRAGRADLDTVAHRQNLDLLIQRALAVPS